MTGRQAQGIRADRAKMSAHICQNDNLYSGMRLRRSLLAVVLLASPLGGCLTVAESRRPLLPAGDALPASVLQREYPSGAGDMVFVHADHMRSGVRYLLSTPSGSAASVAFRQLSDLDPTGIAVEGGEAKAVYLTQVRTTTFGLARLGNHAIKGPEGERYLFGFAALVALRDSGPALRALECHLQGEAKLFDRRDQTTDAARQGRIKALTEFAASRIRQGKCRATETLELALEPTAIPKN